MIEAAIGADFTAELADAPEGIADDLTVEVYDPTTEQIVLGPDADGIEEAQPGRYRATLSMSAAGRYEIRWREAGDIAGVDELIVGGTRFALPMPNATLTSVRGRTGSEDYDYSGADGPEKFTGSEGVYFNLQTERVPTGDSSSVVGTRSLVAPSDLNVDWAIGDVVTFTPHGADAIDATVRLIKATAFPGVPGVVRLILEDA